MIAAVLVALLATSSPARPASTCSLRSIAGCRDTNQLILLPPVQRAIRAFFGQRRETILDHQLLSDVAITGLHGPPATPVRVGSFLRLSACEAHACPTGAAMVVDQAGAIVAVGLLDACARAPVPAQCSAHWTLTIYARGKQPGVVDDLKRWASQQIGGPPIANQPPSTLDTVKLVPLTP